jgi:hypothetical protein
VSDAAAPPKVFISYSWSSDEHKQWVLDLAARLRSDGVDVVLDRWHLKEGHDTYAFMEQMVTDPEVKKVLAICDRKYAEKANKRSGGVGTETQIISAEVYQKVGQEKFVPIIRERDEGGKPYHPAFLSTRMYIDFTNDDEFEEAFDRLLRNIHGRPELKLPEIGKPPTHIFVEDATIVKTAGRYRRLRDAVDKGRPNAEVMLGDYLDELAEALDEFQITSWQKGTEPEIDEVVLDRIHRMTPYRDEFVEFCILYATHLRTDAAYTAVHGFLEKLLGLQYRRGTGIEVGQDPYRFFAYEAFLYLVSSLLKYNQFKTASAFMDDEYLHGTGGYGSQIATSSCYGFNEYVRSLDEYRNARLKLRRVSLTAELVKDRANHRKLGFRELLQTDLVLFLRPSILGTETSTWSYWYPRLLIYGSEQGEAELFARAATPSGARAIRDLFGATSAMDFASKLGRALSTERVRQVVASEKYFRLDLPQVVGWERHRRLLPGD